VPPIAIITMPLDPILFRIGGLAVHWYGLFIALGILVNVPLARWECKRKHISEDLVFNLAVWCVVLGIIGGRLFYVVQADQPGGFDYYIQHPQDIFATWQGGMAFYGMVFAIILTALVFCWRTKAPFWALLDMAAVFLPLGQAFGRLGNVVNGDIIGYPSTLPWAIQYSNPNSLAPDHVIAYQPASLYELLFSLALFGFLWSIRGRVKTPGLLFMFYAFLYSLGQFAIFFLRANSITILDLKQAQLTSLLVMLATLPVMAFLMRHYQNQSQVAGGGPTGEALSAATSASAVVAPSGTAAAGAPAARAKARRAGKPKPKAPPSGSVEQQAT